MSAGIKTKSVRLEHAFFFLLEVNEYRSTRHVARMRCVRYVRLKWKERSIMPRLTILYKSRGISPPIARIFRSHTFVRSNGRKRTKKIDRIKGERLLKLLLKIKFDQIFSPHSLNTAKRVVVSTRIYHRHGLHMG